MKKVGVSRALAALTLVLVAGLVRAADPVDFYRGKTIKLAVGASVGRGYSSHAQAVARHIGGHIPGKPIVVVENMPAGGGLAATNYIYNAASRDGLEIGLFNRYTLLAPLLGVSQAAFKPEQFNWLGTTASYSDNAYVFLVRASLPVKSVDDLRRIDPPLNVGNVSAAPIRVLNEALGLHLKLISGYQGDALDLGFEHGEVDGHTVGYMTMLSTKPYWVTQGLVRILIQFGRSDRLPALAQVPTARELARTPADLSLIEFSEAPIMIGYPFAAPPGVPPERVAILRKAFDDTMADPAFKAEVKAENLEYSPRTGAEVGALVEGLADTPADVVARYKAIQGVTLAP